MSESRGMKRIGHCNMYGFVMHGSIVLWFDDDCVVHKIDFAGGEPIETKVFERILCEWSSDSFARYQWYVNGQPVTQDEAIQIYLEQ